LPTHSLDALFPRWSTEHAVAAVLQNDRIQALTPAAAQAGLLPDMHSGTARGMAPQALLRVRDPAAERRGLQQALLCLLRYTPNIAMLGPHTLALEVHASLDLFGGPRALWRQVRASLQGLGLNTSLAMAPTAQAAWVLAFQASERRRRVLGLKALRRRLDALPPEAMPALEPWLPWLAEIGCRTLGHLRRLPRKGLQQRSHPQLMQSLDAAYGLAEQHFTWLQPPEAFSRRYDALEKLEHVHAVLAVACRLAEQLCGWLQARHHAASRLEFTLHHEKGRHARPPTHVGLALSQAGWRPDDFLPALRERLNRLALDDHVIAVELSASGTQPRAPVSEGLFPEPAQWAAQEHQLLDLLRARLGDDHVLQPRPHASHLPERANCWGPCQAAGGAARPGGLPPSLPAGARPFWLLATPVALNTHNDRPRYQGRPLRLVHGPERLESGWWEDAGHQQRDYFIAQDALHARYWIYRQHGTLDAGWFLHGLFA